MEKSLVVIGKDLEEALDKGALLLHCPLEHIAYEILQNPKPAPYGQRKVPCKLRVTPISPSAEDFDKEAALIAAQNEKIPWDDALLARMKPKVFLVSLQNHISALPKVSLYPQPDQPLAANEAEKREIVHDVTLEDSPLKHEGNLAIYGHVRKGVKIFVEGNLEIVGDVETALLDTTGDIYISGGFLGTARSRFGNIHCKFAQGARLDALNGEIEIAESSMQSYLFAGRRIHIGDILLGGICYAQEKVDVAVAGSESKVPTTLVAGLHYKVNEESEKIRHQAQELLTELHDQDRLCNELISCEEADVALSLGDRRTLCFALIKKTRLNDTLKQMSLQKARLLGMINADRNARICVSDRAYPGVKVQVDNLVLDLQKLTQFATFSKDYETGVLRITPYR